jgi:hypothetical protein
MVEKNTTDAANGRPRRPVETGGGHGLALCHAAGQFHQPWMVREGGKGNAQLGAKRTTQVSSRGSTAGGLAGWRASSAKTDGQEREIGSLDWRWVVGVAKRSTQLSLFLTTPGRPLIGPPAAAMFPPGPSSVKVRFSFVSFRLAICVLGALWTAQLDADAPALISLADPPPASAPDGLIGQKLLLQF